MMARVRPVIADSMQVKSIRWSGPTSTNTVFAPICSMTATDAIKEFGTVIISSPGLIPRATKDIKRASVPLFRDTPWFTPR